MMAMMAKLSLLLLLSTAANVVVQATLNRPAGPVLAEQGIGAVDPNQKIKVGCYYYPCK